MLKVYCGPMFADKTTSLLRECNESVNPIVFKPSIDNRYDVSDIVSHNGIRATQVGAKVYTKPVDWVVDDETLESIALEDNDLVGIDEAQFFVNLNRIIEPLLARGVNVVCTGLDLDSSGEPFGMMGYLLCKADKVIKRTAECSLCGKTATKTFRKLSAPSKDKVLVGGSDLYEPRCSFHWEQGIREWLEWEKQTNNK